MRMTVSILFRVSRDDGTVGPDLESHLDAVMNVLISQGALDPTIGGSLKTGSIEVSVDVDAHKHNQALDRGFIIMREAIEAAGGKVIDAFGELAPPSPSRVEAPSWNRTQLTVAA